MKFSIWCLTMLLLFSGCYRDNSTVGEVFDYRIKPSYDKVFEFDRSNIDVESY